MTWTVIFNVILCLLILTTYNNLECVQDSFINLLDFSTRILVSDPLPNRIHLSQPCYQRQSEGRGQVDSFIPMGLNGCLLLLAGAQLSKAENEVKRHSQNTVPGAHRTGVLLQLEIGNWHIWGVMETPTYPALQGLGNPSALFIRHC